MNLRHYYLLMRVRGGAVGWVYKPESCRFNSRWCHWNFSLT